MKPTSFGEPLLKQADDKDPRALSSEAVAVAVSGKQIAFVIMMASAAGLASLLFGYNMGVYNTAQKTVAKHFGWGDKSDVNNGLVSTMVAVGAVIGAFIAGRLVETIGRRMTLVINNVFFLVGAIILFFANGLGMLIVGRILVGLGTGIASMAAPLYIAEVSPPHLRGALGTMPQLCVTIGILISYFMGLGLPEAGTDTNWWRWMFLVSAFPALLQALLLGVVIPFDTPRFLISKGREAEAVEVLTRLVGPAQVDAEIVNLRGSLVKSEETSSVFDLFKKEYILPLVIGFALASLQQLTGINAIIFFSNEIFRSCQLNDQTLMTIVVGVINVIMTVVASLIMDLAGRRLLLLLGSGFMSAFLMLLVFHVPSWLAATAVFLFVVFFAISLGPIVWLLLSEIYPSKIRGAGMACATGLNWLFAIVIGFGFLPVKSAIGKEYTFLIFSLLCAVTFVFVYAMVPETKGRSLEEIEAMMVRRPKKYGAMIEEP